MNNKANFFTPKESQIIKAISIIAVIILHELTLFPWQMYYHPQYQYPLIFVDQLLRFCVPAFVFISGYGLSRKFSQKKFNLWSHLNKWLILTLPLYLIWSGYIIWALNWYQPWDENYQVNSWLQIFLYGKADYHLYFIPMLLQLYLIFPLIWKLGKNYLWLITPIALVFQLWAYGQYQVLGYGDQFQYLLFSSWIGYFCVGIWFGKQMPKKQSKSLIILLLISSLYLLYQQAYELLQQTNNIVFSMRSTKPLVVLYSLLFLYGLSIRVFPLEKLSWLQKFGKYSLILYLSHTLVIRYFKIPFNNFETHFLGIGSFLAMILISVLWHKHGSKIFRLLPVRD